MVGRERFAGWAMIIAGMEGNGIVGSKVARIEGLKGFWYVDNGEYEYNMLRAFRH